MVDSVVNTPLSSTTHLANPGPVMRSNTPNSQDTPPIRSSGSVPLPGPRTGSSLSHLRNRLNPGSARLRRPEPEGVAHQDPLILDPHNSQQMEDYTRFQAVQSFNQSLGQIEQDGERFANTAVTDAMQTGQRVEVAPR